MPESVSQFQFYSVAIVAANKKLTTDRIEAVPMEDEPMLDGELSDDAQKSKSKSSSTEKEHYESELDTTASVQARWLPLGSDNRITAPDVRRGEKVMLYRYADTDEYWWMPLTQSKKLRRLETVIYSYSNETKENVEVNNNNSYWLEISTHNQAIHLHTSKNNNEPFEYDIQINTKEGCIIIKDDDDNYIIMDSKERQIKLHNRDDSFVDINKKKIQINAIDEVKITTNNFRVQAKENISMNARNYSLSVSGYITTAGSYQVKTGDAQFSGSVTAAGRVSASHIHGNSYSGGHHN